MFIRCAFFRGHVKAGRQAAFDDHIAQTMIPLWSAFPGAQEVRVLREVESDRPDTRFELVIAMRFATREAIAAALESEVRWSSKAASQTLFDLFEGDVFHTVFRAQECPLPV